MSEKPQYPPLRSPMIVDGQLTDPWIKYFQLVVTPYFEKLLNLEDMEALNWGDSQQKDHERRIVEMEKLIQELWQTNDKGFTKRLDDLETALQFVDGPKDATLLRKLDELETLIYGTLYNTTGSVSDEAYAASWDGVTAIAPSKNAVYDAFVQANVVGLKITDSPVFITVKLSGLTDGYIPYHVADATGLANSGLYWDGTRLGIETTTPVAKFTVISPDTLTSPGFSLRQSNNNAYGYDFDTENISYGRLDLYGITNNVRTQLVTFMRSGNVGIGMTPTVQFELSGAVGQKASGTTWSNPSDSRLKKDIKLADLNRCYEIVKSIPLKRYTLRDDVFSSDKASDRSKLGWIAEDVKPLFPKATPIVPFTLPTQIPDGEEKYQEQEYSVEEVEKEEMSIEIIDGKPVQVKKVIKKKIKLFDTVEVVDEAGKIVIQNGKLLTYQMPRMITRTRPKFRQEVIEDCLTLDADQIYASMYGTIQVLIMKVEKLEGKIYAS